MAKTKRKIKNRKRKGKIRISENVQLVHKNDKTRVAKDTMMAYPKAPTIVPTNGVVFRVKIKKK